MSETFKKVLNLEADSERKKRATILKSVGIKQSEINRAQGYKKARIQEAEGQAQQIWLGAEAVGNRISFISQSLTSNVGANYALKYKLAENYLDSLEKMADPSKQVIVKKAFNDPNEQFQKAFQNFEDNLEPENSDKQSK